MSDGKVFGNCVRRQLGKWDIIVIDIAWCCLRFSSVCVWRWTAWQNYQIYRLTFFIKYLLWQSAFCKRHLPAPDTLVRAAVTWSFLIKNIDISCSYTSNHEIPAVLGCYSVWVGSYLPTFRDNLSVLSSEVMQSKKKNPGTLTYAVIRVILLELLDP